MWDEAEHMVETIRPSNSEVNKVRKMLTGNGESPNKIGRRDMRVARSNGKVVGACIAIDSETIAVPKIVTMPGCDYATIAESLLLSVIEDAEGRPIVVSLEQGDDKGIIACLSAGFHPKRTNPQHSLDKIEMVFR